MAVLTKHDPDWIRDSIDPKEFGRVYQWRIGGLPVGQTAKIVAGPNGWQILRTIGGFEGELYGSFATDDDAVAALAEEIACEAGNRKCPVCAALIYEPINISVDGNSVVLCSPECLDWVIERRKGTPTPTLHGPK